MEDAPLVPGVQVAGVGETHQRRPRVADPDLAGAVRESIEKDVHHAAVFVKLRGLDLERARAAFPERHVAVGPRE
jgi:hypothetical protein